MPLESLFCQLFILCISQSTSLMTLGSNFSTVNVKDKKECKTQTPTLCSVIVYSIQFDFFVCVLASFDPLQDITIAQNRIYHMITDSTLTPIESSVAGGIAIAPNCFLTLVMARVMFNYLLVLFIQVLLSSGNYELQVKINSFTILCNSQQLNCGCCDVNNRCTMTPCSYNLRMCHRPAGSLFSYIESEYPQQVDCSGGIEGSRNWVEGAATMYSFSEMGNSFAFTEAEDWPIDGVQILIEVQDTNASEHFDRFVVNVTTRVGTTERNSYTGIFASAILDITLSLQCTSSFYGVNCERYCTQSICECDPGFTGEFCSISINDCVNISCGQNQMCVDDHLSFTCECEPGYTGLDCMDIDMCADMDCNFGRCVQEEGSHATCICRVGYTGPNCSVDIDQCEGINCNSGTCEQTRASYRCDCPSGHYGEYCENQSSYQLNVHIPSASNPDGRCADRNCSEEICCDGPCPQRVCHYYLYYCLRPVGTPVSYEPTIDQGNCMAENTMARRGSGVLLTYTFTLFGLEWHPEGIQLYIELIDGDFQASKDQLIDRFVVNITSLGTASGMYQGIFKLAAMEVDTEIICRQESCNFLDSSTSQVELKAALPASIIVAVFLIAVIIAATTCIAVKKKRQLVKYGSNENSHVDFVAYEDATVMGITSSHLSSSLRVGAESNPNTYIARSNTEWDTRGHTNSFRNPGFEIKSDNSESTGIYDYIQQALNDDDYDYESPYWAPADKKTELLNQLKKLRIPSVAQMDLGLKELLGRGAFGEVYKGEWRHVVAGCEKPVEEEVAVKTMEDTSKEEDRIKFLQEAVIMGQFDNSNIVKIMGIMATEDSYKLVIEFMAKGDLRKHLPTLKERFSNALELSSQLLYYSRQVASGMDYLNYKGYIHRDLAARNILVSNDDICKIGDFGLSREMQNEDFYKAQKGGKVPVKWTAPEALNYRLYSAASDVWSFGCVLYEIWSLGVKPFHDLNNFEAIKVISKGNRLHPPPGCPRAIYTIMIKSWNENAESRPEINAICTQLNLPEFRVLKWSEEDAASYSEKARTVGASLAEGEVLFKELQRVYTRK